MAAGSRREARERALSLLYEAYAKELTPDQVLADLPVAPDPFAVDLVRGVGESAAELDTLIQRFAVDWTLDRMPVIDLAVLRLAAYELLHRPDVPTNVVVSEAVELAIQYSTDESGRYVNGVLGSMASEVRRSG